MQLGLLEIQERQRLFESDDDTYIVAKSALSIVLMKKADREHYIVTNFDAYDESVSIRPQYLMAGNDTIADEPVSPVSAYTTSAFDHWCQDKYLLYPYDFSDNGSALPGEGNPKIATIYGLWRKSIKVTVVTNNGGIGLDGSTLPDVLYKEGEVLDPPYAYKVATVTFLVPMGKPLNQSDEFTFEDLYTHHVISYGRASGELDNQLQFTRDGMTQTTNWWTKNGFNNGRGDGGCK